MIQLTRLNHELIVINLSAIATIERTPDTMITLLNHDRILVLESVDEVVARAAAHMHRIHEGHLQVIGSPEGSG